MEGRGGGEAQGVADPQKTKQKNIGPRPSNPGHELNMDFESWLKLFVNHSMTYYLE
jgi:hypothetical protein